MSKINFLLIALVLGMVVYMPYRLSVDMALLWVGLTVGMEFMVYHKKLTTEDPVYESARLLAQMFFPGIAIVVNTVATQSVFLGITSMIWFVSWLFAFKRNIQSFKPGGLNDRVCS